MASSQPPAPRPEPGGHPSHAPTGVRAALPGTRARLKAHDVPSLAAGVAFKIFLALFPALAAAVAVFALVGDPDVLIDRFGAVLPDEVQALLGREMEGLAGAAGAGGILTAGVLGGLWVASSAAATLIKALNRLHGVEESRNVLAQRGVALLLVGALLGALASLLAAVVLGPQLRRLVLPEDLVGGLAGPVMTVVQVAAAVLILALLFAFVYWIGPNRKRPEWRWLSPGSVLGVLGWLALSGGFTLYTQTAGDYQATYGILAGAIVTMIWLQLSMTVLLAGAALDAEIEWLGERATAVEDGAGGGLLEHTEPLQTSAPVERALLGAPQRSRRRRVFNGVLLGGLFAAAAARTKRSSG